MQSLTRKYYQYGDVVNSKSVFLKSFVKYQTPCQIWCSMKTIYKRLSFFQKNFNNKPRRSIITDHWSGQVLEQLFETKAVD